MCRGFPSLDHMLRQLKTEGKPRTSRCLVIVRPQESPQVWNRSTIDTIYCISNLGCKANTSVDSGYEINHSGITFDCWTSCFLRYVGPRCRDSGGNIHLRTQWHRTDGKETVHIRCCRWTVRRRISQGNILYLELTNYVWNLWVDLTIFNKLP